jgi:hypothetical protein
MGAWASFLLGPIHTQRGFSIILLVTREGRKGADIPDKQ